MLEPKDILKLAKLSRLEITEAEVADMQGHLQNMLAHLDELRSLDLTNVEPMTAVDEPATVLRADVPGETLSAERAFQNAPRVDNNHFVIPKVIA